MAYWKKLGGILGLGVGGFGKKKFLDGISPRYWIVFGKRLGIQIGVIYRGFKGN